MAESFSKAFAAARKKLGAGKTFEWNGKKYTTDYKEEVGKKQVKPKARPEGMGAKPKVNSEAPTMGAAPKGATLKVTNPTAKKAAANPPSAPRSKTPPTSSLKPKANPGPIARKKAGYREAYVANKKKG